MSGYEPVIRELVLPPQLSVGDLMGMIEGRDPAEVLSISIESPQQLIFHSIGLLMDYRDHTIVGPNASDVPTVMEFDILDVLASNAGVVQDREVFMDKFWSGLPTRSLDVHIKRIRRRFEGIGVTPDVIRTYRGIGYAFVAEPPEVTGGSSKRELPEESAGRSGAEIIFDKLNLCLNLDMRSISGPDGTVTPRATEFEFLRHLVSKADRVHSNISLLNTHFAGRTPPTLRVYVRRVRNMLESIGVPGQSVESIRGVGYIFRSEYSEEPQAVGSNS